MMQVLAIFMALEALPPNLRGLSTVGKVNFGSLELALPPPGAAGTSGAAPDGGKANDGKCSTMFCKGRGRATS